VISLDGDFIGSVELRLFTLRFTLVYVVLTDIKEKKSIIGVFDV